MKALVLLVATMIGFSQAGMANTFWGPAYNCNFTHKEHFPNDITMSVFTAGIFGPSAQIQLLYAYPQLGIDMSLISELSTDEPDAQVYSGEISNIDYLVDVTLDLPNSKMTIVDKDKTYEFEGECVAASFE